MSTRICYGSGDKNIDVTDLVKKYMVKDGLIRIPFDDCIRAFIFGDPCFGIIKEITVFDGKITKYNAASAVFHPVDWPDSENILPYLKLYSLHEEIKFVGGSMMEEYPEQILACKYISPEANVLEIGANIGRNSCIISKLLNNSLQLVSMECSPHSAALLSVNKQINNLSFNIEISALSKRRLIQRGWVTKPIEKEEPIELGWTLINTIDWNNLKSKYNKIFDTLVLDCEGAFYWILLDEPDILKDVTLIIVENDYQDILHKEYVDQELVKAGFSCIFSQKGGWGPCVEFFYQVWKKDPLDNNDVKIYYGRKGILRDVTNITFEKCRTENCLFIPRSDIERSNIYGDHAFGQKSVFVNAKEYPVGQDVAIHLSEKKYNKNIYLVDLNPGHNYGLCHQLWCIVNTLLIGHHVERDVMVKGFYPDYNAEKSIDLEKVIDIDATNKSIEGLGIRSKIVKYDKFLSWKESSYQNPVYLGPWQNMMGKERFDIMNRVLKFEDDYKFVDLYTCFVYPVFTAYGYDPVLCSFATKIINCLVPSTIIKEKINLIIPNRKFHCIHLRLEDDWVNHVTATLKSCSHFGKTVTEYSKQVFEQIVNLITINMNDNLPIYIASGLGKMENVNNRYLDQLQVLFPERILKNNSNFFEGRELNGYIDYSVALCAEKFIGGNLSSFSYSIRTVRLAEQKACFDYDG